MGQDAGRRCRGLCAKPRNDRLLSWRAVLSGAGIARDSSAHVHALTVREEAGRTGSGVPFVALADSHVQLWFLP